MMLPPKVRLGSERPAARCRRHVAQPQASGAGDARGGGQKLEPDRRRIHGEEIPGAKLSIYQGVGHSPFFEAAPRFNAELAAFVRSAQKGN